AHVIHHTVVTHYDTHGPGNTSVKCHDELLIPREYERLLNRQFCVSPNPHCSVRKTEHVARRDAPYISKNGSLGIAEPALEQKISHSALVEGVADNWRKPKGVQRIAAVEVISNVGVK